MTTGINELANQVAGRLWQLASATIAARVELEIARKQADLLAQAAALRRSHGKLGEQIARRLEQVSERLVCELADDADGLKWEIDLPQAALSDGAAGETLTSEGNAAGMRRRGRPKKSRPDRADPVETPGTDATAQLLDEVSDEERTDAHDPAGADQVRDLSAEDVQR